MALWRLPSGVEMSATADLSRIGAQSVEPVEGASSVGAEVLPVDELPEAVDEVDGPGEHADEGTAPRRPAKSASKAEP